jgi:hypothetical protein
LSSCTASQPCRGSALFRNRAGLVTRLSAPRQGRAIHRCWRRRRASG